MKKVLFLVLGLFLIPGFQSVSFAQPSIEGDWLFDISGADKGAAFITFDGANPGTFEGYGFVMGGGVIFISGIHSVDSKGKINGGYNTSDEFSSPRGGGTIVGKVDKKGTKISIKLSEGPNAKGIRAPVDPLNPPALLEPELPKSWLVTGSGQGGTRVAFTTFTVTKETDAAYPHRVYAISGEGWINGVEPITVRGGFYLNAKNVAYGGYEALDGNGDPLEDGVFTGKINLSSRKFSFKLLSSLGSKGTMKGQALPQ